MYTLRTYEFVKDTCYSLHGFPKSTYKRGVRSGSGGSRGGRTSGRGRGGFAGRSSSTPAVSEGDRAIVQTLTNDQWSQLLTALKSSKVPVTSNGSSGVFCYSDWVIDSGASNHMFGNLELYPNLYVSHLLLICLMVNKLLQLRKEKLYCRMILCWIMFSMFLLLLAVYCMFLRF